MDHIKAMKNIPSLGIEKGGTLEYNPHSKIWKYKKDYYGSYIYEYSKEGTLSLYITNFYGTDILQPYINKGDLRIFKAEGLVALLGGVDNSFAWEKMMKAKEEKEKNTLWFKIKRFFGYGK
jgi:hypothetical protein